MIRRLLNYQPFGLDFGLLILRVGAGAALLTHGWPKLTGFQERASKFADPYGMGSEISLGLAVFAEFFCSIFLILGLYTRLALIPLVILMATIVLVIHAADPFGKKEVAVLYFIIFLCLFFAGPGKYSVDGIRK